MTINLPVSIGDHVYFIRDHENQKRIAFGTIKEIFFSQDMRLMIRVKGYRAAEWGVKAFRTRKEAETAIGNTVWESASDAQKNATAVYNAMVEYVRNALTESKESQKKQVFICSLSKNRYICCRINTTTDENIRKYILVVALFTTHKVVRDEGRMYKPR